MFYRFIAQVSIFLPFYSWLGVVLVGLAHWYINGVYNYWKKRGVPNPPPKLLVGNIGASLVMTEHLATIYTNMYNNYKDYLYVGFYKMLQPAILARDVDLIKHITTKEFSSFHDNDLEIDENIDPLFGRNPFFLKGQRWKVVRSQVTSAITAGKIKQMFMFMRNISNDLVEYLNSEPDATSQEGLEAKELACKFTTDVVAACAFGLDGNSLKDPDAEFRRMGKKIFSFDFISTVKAILVFILPTLGKVLKIGLISSEVKDWFIGILSQAIKFREENNIVRNDYLDLMLSLKNKPGEYEFTDMDVMAQSMTFFSDGMETSAITLSFALYEIAKNPYVQEKLRQEIDQVLAKHDGELDYEAIQEMPYLDMVISETLRMHPAIMVLQKVCTKQCTLPHPKGEGDGVVVNPGLAVAIPVYAIHYDPQYYPDPQKYDPERFTEDAKKDRPKCAFIPFGEGPRKCLGFLFALAQIKAALVATISNFEVTVNSKTSPTMEIDKMNFLLEKKGGIWLNFYKRSK